MKWALTTFKSNKEQPVQDNVLVEEAKKDSSRFAALYKKYYAPIYLFILKRVESEDIADDITSQVFLKALTNLSKYKDMGFPFSSWLFRIARNEMYDMYHKQKIQMVVSIEKKGIGDMIVEMGEEDKEDHSALRIALDALEADEMELVELRFFEKRPFKEVGEILEITENNAKVRTYRVLDKLKKLLKDAR
jgi:RNA polymerase sigma-70 factor (ECF subfamily)